MTFPGDDQSDEVRDLIRRYGLEEDREHVIIPFTGERGQTKRCFLLKRRFIRIVHPDGQFDDYPLAEAIVATVRHPEMPLSEALHLLRKDLPMPMIGVSDTKVEDEKAS